MELKEYIKFTITSISEGLIEAQRDLSSKGVIVNPEKVEIGKNGEKLLRSDGWRYVQNLDFDIKVAVEESGGAEGGGGLRVAGIVSVGGKIEESTSQQQTNNLRFTIPVALPATKTPEGYSSRLINYGSTSGQD